MIFACLWFLTRNRQGEKHRDRWDEVLFIDARKMGRIVDRTHCELTDDVLVRIADTYHDWRGEDSTGEYADVPGFCKGAMLGRYVDTATYSLPAATWAWSLSPTTVSPSRRRWPGWTRLLRQTWNGGVGGNYKGGKMIRPTDIEPREEYRIWLRYSNGAAGEIALSHLAGYGICKIGDDRACFGVVYIAPAGSISQGENVELCPDALYIQLTGKSGEETMPNARFLVENV